MMSSGGITQFYAKKVTHNLFISFSWFLTYGFSNKPYVPKLWHHLPTFKLTTIYSYCAIATTHGSSFDGINFAGCLEASGMLKATRMLIRISILTNGVSFGISPEYSCDTGAHKERRVQISCNTLANSCHY